MPCAVSCLSRLVGSLTWRDSQALVKLWPGPGSILEVLAQPWLSFRSASLSRTRTAHIPLPNEIKIHDQECMCTCLTPLPNARAVLTQPINR